MISSPERLQACVEVCACYRTPYMKRSDLLLSNIFIIDFFYFQGVWSTPPANERKLNDAYRVRSIIKCLFVIRENSSIGSIRIVEKG